MRHNPLVIFGLGELAEVAAFYFEHDSDRQVAAFASDGEFLQQDSFCSKPAVALETLEQDFPTSDYDLFVAVGYSKINGLREQKCQAALDKGYKLASYVSSKASLFPNFSCGWNCFILEDNTIQPFAQIGNGVTLWSGNHIGHHSKIGDFAFISSHVVISGGVSVGARTFMGVNSTTNDHITIGQRCVIGSGSLVTKDVADEGVVTAEPARLAKIPSSKLRGF